MQGVDRVRGSAAAAVPMLAAAGLAALALWAHFPGHVSMDSSMQLYEAAIGRSMTWNPPYMTAILRWLGVGPEAAGRLMGINVVGTYLALASVGAVLLAARARQGRPVALRAALVLVILANPILFLFVGIVWKDILFATLVTAGTAAGLVACATGGRRMLVAAVFSAVVLAVAMKVRQQGVFMAPVLLAVPMLAVALDRGVGRGRAWLRAGAVVACFAVALVASGQMVARTIETDPKFGNQVGFRGLMQYDVAGMTALSQTPSDRFPLPMSDALRAEVRRVYSPDRGDFLWYSPTVTQWLSLPGYDGIRRHWWTLVRAEPGAYLQHRWDVFNSILNTEGVLACLPMHVGIDGERGYLSEMGFEPGLDRYDRDLYGLSQTIIRWPIYRHWVYLAALAVLAVLVLASPMQRRMKWGVLVAAFATLLLYASYLPTSIACDFRYLFAGICMVSLLWIAYIADAQGRPRLPTRARRGGG